MLQATEVTLKEELVQIHQLNRQNLKQNLSAEEISRQGFVTWLYSIELLEQLHKLTPSVIVKDDEKVIAYALTTLKESAAFHPDLQTMINNLAPVEYKGLPLSSYNFYCMGQICVAKKYRGMGVVNLLYQKHKELYSTKYDFILTEISANNHRSIKAHEKIGFETIYQYSDATDEWNVVVWDWK